MSTIDHIISSSRFDSGLEKVERYGIPTEHRAWVSQPTSPGQPYTDLDPTYVSSFYSTSKLHETGTDIISSIPSVSIYEYLALSQFYHHQILNFSALKSKLFEVSKTKELPEAMSSVTSFPVGNHRIQLNIHSHKNPSQKPSQIGKSHSDGGSYP